MKKIILICLILGLYVLIQAQNNTHAEFCTPPSKADFERATGVVLAEIVSYTDQCITTGQDSTCKEYKRTHTVKIKEVFKGSGKIGTHEITTPVYTEGISLSGNLSTGTTYMIYDEQYYLSTVCHPNHVVDDPDKDPLVLQYRDLSSNKSPVVNHKTLPILAIIAGIACLIAGIMLYKKNLRKTS